MTMTVNYIAQFKTTQVDQGASQKLKSHRQNTKNKKKNLYLLESQ